MMYSLWLQQLFVILTAHVLNILFLIATYLAVLVVVSRLSVSYLRITLLPTYFFNFGHINFGHFWSFFLLLLCNCLVTNVFSVKPQNYHMNRGNGFSQCFVLRWWSVSFDREFGQHIQSRCVHLNVVSGAWPAVTFLPSCCYCLHHRQANAQISVQWSNAKKWVFSLSSCVLCRRQWNIFAGIILVPRLSSSTLSFVLLLFCAVFGVSNGSWPWLSLASPGQIASLLVLSQSVTVTDNMLAESAFADTLESV